MTTTTQYDPRVIQEYSEELYRKARKVVIWNTINSALLVAILGAILGTSLLSVVLGQRAWGVLASPGAGAGMVAVLSVVGAIIGAFNGYHSGSARAFHLKLTAQTALCQKQIELNTRRTALANMAGTGPQQQQQQQVQRLRRAA